MELLVHQLVTTHEPCMYGSLIVMDKSSVSPGKISHEVLFHYDSLFHAGTSQLCGGLQRTSNLNKIPHFMNITLLHFFF